MAAAPGGEGESIYARATRQLLEVLEPADLLFALSNNDAGFGIVEATAGEHSHVALWTGEKVLEATIGGVREVALADFVKGRVYVDVYRFPAASEKRHEVVAAARALIDKPYAEFELSLSIALGAVTVWLRYKYLQYNALVGAGQLVQRATSARNHLRSIAQRLLDLTAVARDEFTCVALLLAAFKAAGIPPINIQLHVGSELALPRAVRGVLVLLKARAKTVQASEEGAGPAPPGSHLEAVAIREQEWAALEESLDWLDGFAAEIERETSGERPEHEISVADAKALVLKAGEDWPSALVTPVQLAKSTDLVRKLRVQVEDPQPGPATLAETAGLPRK